MLSVHSNKGTPKGGEVVNTIYDILEDEDVTEGQLAEYLAGMNEGSNEADE